MTHTDEEIKKILECCGKSDCENCNCDWSYVAEWDCMRHIERLALDLINRQQFEIYRLNAEIRGYQLAKEMDKEHCERLQAEIESLEAECERQYEQAEADIRANIADGGTSCHWCMDKHRAETIKDFADRLKDYFCDSCSTHKKYRLEIEQCRAKENPNQKWCFKMRLIDNLVKETVGE